MSEITPASSPNNRVESNPSSPTTSAISVDLAPILISPSKILWRIELVVYISVICAASAALFPFFSRAFYWPLLWLMFTVLVSVVIHRAWCVKNSLPVSLSIQKQVWRLKCPDEITVSAFGEILMWSNVIILPLRETISGRKHRLVLLPDSVKKDDWRHLRVWLRTGLRKNL